MSTIIYHNHHIIPKHAGGTDHPDNIARLTTTEHAEAHRLLYEKYGRWQDKTAYEGLAGFKGREEIIEEISHRPTSEETKKKIADAQTGKVHTPETKKKMSEAKTGRKRKPFTEEHKKNMSKNSVGMRGKKHSSETRKKISESLKGGKASEETRKKLSEMKTGKKRGPYKKGHYDIFESNTRRKTRHQ